MGLLWAAGQAAQTMLLGGWLLMEPPMRRHLELIPAMKYTVELDAPITRWTQFAAYDTAAACEKRRLAVHDLRSRYDATIDDLDRARDHPVALDLRMASYIAGFAMRCVPSEQVYPPQGEKK